MLRTLILLSLVLPMKSLALGDETRDETHDGATTSHVDGKAALAFDLGGGVPSLLIPRGEVLEFGVHVAVGPLGATVGTVKLESGVDPYVESLLLLAPTPTADGPSKETGWLRAKADGGYLFYSMETILDSRYLPKAWPLISHFYKQSGSENRRKESLIGMRDGRFQTSYRADTKHGAPAGQRIWKSAEFRDVPEGSVDMLGAVYLARTLLASGDESLSFPLLDKDKLWQMTLERGEEKQLEVPAGTYDAVEIKLIPSTWPGEPEAESKKFRGLFGIRGSIHLWVDKTTGVPIRIQGDVPAGPVTVNCDIYLEKSTGTPDAFMTIAEKATLAAK
jgi:hypothetical protein